MKNYALPSPMLPDLQTATSDNVAKIIVLVYAEIVKIPQTS